MDTYAYDYSTDYTDLSGILAFVPVDELDDMAMLRRIDAKYETCRTIYSAYNADGISYGWKTA